MDNKLILVYYIGVKSIDDEDIPEYMNKVAKSISINSVECEIIFIPVMSYDTRIECINPKYITDNELIFKHNNLMNELNYELQNQINILKTNKDE